LAAVLVAVLGCSDFIVTVAAAAAVGDAGCIGSTIRGAGRLLLYLMSGNRSTLLLLLLLLDTVDAAAAVLGVAQLHQQDHAKSI
jgi:hypothetical protein